MKRYGFWLITLFALAACGPSAEEIASQTAAAETQIAASWTDTPTPTLTPTSTSTPTVTPTPTPTDTPTPTPLVFDSPGLIAFNRLTDNGIYVYAIKPDGQYEVQIVTGPGVFLGPSWSPDGGKLAFIEIDQETGLLDAWVADIAAGEPAQQVTVGGIYIETILIWSPDGQYLLFGGSQPDAETDVYRIDVETGQVLNLTRSYGGWDYWPDWSPDGEWIAFTSDRLEDGSAKGLDDVWIMKPDGSGLQNVTNQPMWEDVKPAWSPDSRQIAFYRWSYSDDISGGPAGLYVINPDGSGEELLYGFEPFLSEPPVWSPDGKWIGFTYQENVWVISSDGGEPIQISDLPGSEGRISWSPDSQALIYDYESETDEQAIYIAVADGSDSKLLIDDDMSEWFGNWSP